MSDADIAVERRLCAQWAWLSREDFHAIFAPDCLYLNIPMPEVRNVGPDAAHRMLSRMAERWEVSLQVIGCETGDATFAVMFADLGDAGRAGEVLAQCKEASLSNQRATRSRETTFRPEGALALPHSLQVVARGQRADGSEVESQAAYFAHGRHVFQAVIYTGQLKPELADPFFSGLKFQ